MPRKIRVLVACGTSIATATVAASKVREIAQESGLNADVAQCKALEIRGKIQTYAPDIIIAMTPVPKDLGIPVFNGIPFLSGIGIDKLSQDILAAMQAAS